LLVKPPRPHHAGRDREVDPPESDLGLAPSNDGVVDPGSTFPPLTEQRRKEYVKVVKNMAEDGRVRGPANVRPRCTQAPRGRREEQG